MAISDDIATPNGLHPSQAGFGMRQKASIFYEAMIIFIALYITLSFPTVQTVLVDHFVFSSFYGRRSPKCMTERPKACTFRTSITVLTASDKTSCATQMIRRDTPI